MAIGFLLLVSIGSVDAEAQHRSRPVKIEGPSSASRWPRVFTGDETGPEDDAVAPGDPVREMRI
jgi:hypothetical protein